MPETAMDTMKAVVITRPGGPEVLEVMDMAVPSPVRGEVRVRVRATAVNRVDLLQRLGAYPPPPDSPQDIPGVEFAGEVDALGEGVTEFARGDRVFGLAGGGTYAQHVICHSRTLVRIPEQIGFIEAAAVPEAFITAYDAMVIQGRLSAGETVLIHAVGSGVGTAAVQIAGLIGARAIGTARSQKKLELAQAVGMSEGLVADDGRFASDVMQLTDGRGVDLVLELVGGDYLTEDVQCVAGQGRIVLVGLVAGTRAELDLSVFLRKRLEIHGTVLRARPLEEKIIATQAFARHVVPFLKLGVLRPVIDRVYPLAAAADAHEYLGSNANFGKVVLEVD